MRERAPAAEWRVCLVGNPAVVLAEGRSVPLERRAAAVLALAALEPGISRLRVATLLWPDSSDPRRNLRQQLLRFRQTFGRELLVGTDTLSLAGDLVAEPGGGPTDAPLLGTHDYSDCEDFSAWLQLQRETRRDRGLAALRQQLADGEAAGDLDAALEAAKTLLSLDAHAEIHHRELMRLHYLRGDNAAGLAAYRRLNDMLAADHGTRPSAASEQLAEVLRASRQPPERATAALGSSVAHQALPVTLKRPPLLAGREPERAAALTHWADGRAVLLEGEAGLGKSRLMAELLQGTGAALFAAGRPGDAGTPYATLARLLRPLLEGAGELGAGLDESARKTLAHIAPVAVAADAPSALPALRPGAMAAAVSALLQQGSVSVVALDDLHFADEATLELIAGMVAPTDPPRRWLFAARTAELSPAAQSLRRSLAEMLRLGVVTLAGLDEGAIAALVDGLAIHGLQGCALAAPLWRHTGGNPLFVLETLKHGLADGSLARGELPRPQSVGGLIERRLQSLSEPALTLARVAAIAGVDFSIELAEAAIGVRAVQLASAWREPQDAQVLRDENFAHDLVCDAALRSVPPVVARRVHGQCAQWLSAHAGEPARVAWHWHLAGVPAEAGRAFVAAALRAEKAARLHEEAALYGHAAKAFGQANLDEERFSAQLNRVRALSQREFDDQAMQECRALVASAGTDAQRLRAQSELCGLLTERSESLAAIEAGKPAMALARRLNENEWQVRTACHIATALCRLGRADEAVALLAPLRAWVDGQGDDLLRMLWHGDWGAALSHTGRLSEAVAAFDVALKASQRLGLRDAEGRLLLNCSVSLRQSGRLDHALALSRQGQALSAAESRDVAERPINALVLARDESETGHYASALASVERVLRAFEHRGAAFWVQACRMVLVRLWLDLGQHARAVPLLRDEADDLPAWLRGDRRLLHLELARALEQPAHNGAVDAILELADADPQRGPGLRVRALRNLPPAQVLAQAETLAKALAAKERFGALLSLHVHVARAALAEGRIDLAETAARAALGLFDEGYAPESMYRPEAHLVAWRALTEAGAHRDAAAALSAGIDWIRRCALPQVPAPFIDSFLHRNPVNRDLLAAATAANSHG